MTLNDANNICKLFFEPNLHDLEDFSVLKNKHILYLFVTLYYQYYNMVSSGGHSTFFINGGHSTKQWGMADIISTEPDKLHFLIETINIAQQKMPTIDFSELISVIEKIVNVEIDETNEIEGDCSYCSGYGYEYNDDTEEEEDCSECQGFGTEQIENPNYGGLTENFEDKIRKLDYVLYKLHDTLILSLAQLIIKKRLHSDIGSVFEPYKTMINVENF